MTDARDLETRGWKRCFVTDEPRLSEAVELYEELGLDVLLVPVPADDAECTECMTADPDRFRIIYTRERRVS